MRLKKRQEIASFARNLKAQAVSKARKEALTPSVRRLLMPLVSVVAALVGLLAVPGTAQGAERTPVGIQQEIRHCTDIGNGDLCVHMSGVRGSWGLVTVWYKKLHGAPVTVDLGYQPGFSNTTYTRFRYDTVAIGQQTSHQWKVWFPQDMLCIHPRLHVRYGTWFTGFWACN